uniref:Hemolysin A n=1 Tax=Arundo donax TaxID=35708 RepID=A0A0A9HA84_ARUDO
MPAVIKVMKTDSTLITLIKPQFEAHRSQVGGGGIVRDPLVHEEVLDRIISGVEEFGFSNKGWIESPLKGAEGNTEFLACFHRIPMPEPQPEAESEAT